MNLTVTLIIETLLRSSQQRGLSRIYTSPDSLIKYMHLCANTKSNCGANV